MKHGFPSILCSSKKDEEHIAERSALTRPGLVASADELRGRRKLCRLQCPCVEFVLDSHALKLRALVLILKVETGISDPLRRVGKNEQSLVQNRARV